jgi:hypothetical protein
MSAGRDIEPPEVELVVARYQEPVAWLRRVPRSIHVRLFDKGGDLTPADVPRSELVRLPNLGREAHTYLHHLLTRRDALAPLTVFCQGHPFDHASDFHRTLRALATGEERVQGFRWLGFIIDTDDDRGRRLFVPWSKNPGRRELRLDRFHLALFDAPCPPRVRFFPGAQFAVTAERARARPADFYARALELSSTFPDAAHCFERLWDRVFGVSGVDEASLQGQDTVYLKPIRRLQRPGS